jgi:hypothetical protein
MNLDWNALRPLNRGRDKGFEELRAQLACQFKGLGSIVGTRQPAISARSGCLPYRNQTSETTNNPNSEAAAPSQSPTEAT